VNPICNTINNIIEGFEKIGSEAFMANKNKEPDEKRKEVKNQWKTMIAEFRNFSIPKGAVAIQVYPTLVCTMLYDNLHLKPPKFH